ncbi:MAG: SUMF1/EgtB/PvdO family nonheme iron enzyme [Acidobacteria bacterium]|nr:SUMF1/EgtB/PvdO family nonheme iron enzyme [Acidobacteriota bacterium]
MLRSGTKIGDYILVEKLGSGGFGDVWKAEKRTALDVNHFALKFFRPREDGIDFEKIGRELAVWKQLRGLPHIISLIELDRFEDYVYVVCDFADGGSLETWLRNNGGKAPTHEAAVRIALEILTGLEKLHEKGFVHRDLKPDNVLIMNGTPCIADFGVSREIKTHSKATGTAGTMEYMPPEAFDKRPSVTPETDIWAVGVMLQRLLTGGLPYPQDDQPSLIAAILMSEPDPLPPDVPQSLRAIVGKALRKKREERFSTADEMRAALADALRPVDDPSARKSASMIVDEEFERAREAEMASRAEKERIRQDDQRPSDDASLIEPSEASSTSPVEPGTVRKNLIGMEFVYIPPGDFMMGSDKSDDEKPVRKVTISEGFWMGKYEVTQGQWRALMDSNPSYFKTCGDDCPVEQVSWNDAVEFIAKLNEKNDGFEYSLPSEAEWEYAARAGTTGDHYDSVDEIAWHNGNSDFKTHPVGGKKPNSFGLFDMSGNVCEWVQDIYNEKGYGGLPTDGSANLSVGDPGSRVLRGGSWFDGAYNSRSALRFRNSPSLGLNCSVGFRVLARQK